MIGTKHRKRLSAKSSAILSLVLLVAAQVLLIAATVAQTVEPGPGTATPSGSGNALSGGAASTQHTVPNPYIDAVPFVPTVNNSSNVNVHGGAYNGGSTDGIQRNVDDLIRRDNAYGSAENAGLTTLVFQTAEQLRANPNQDVNNILNTSLGSVNETYRGLHQWFKDDLVGNLFSQIGQLIGKWISELIDGWIADTVQFLSSFLRVFVLNPNVAVNGLNGSPSDGISPYIRQGADVMYGIAVDLLLLLFILAIWKYWAEAAWRGGGNLMGAVGRLIFTAGLMLAFPTLYAFEIQISNEMIKAIYFNSSDQIMMLNSALASAVRGGILAGVGGLASAFAPLLGGLGLGVIGGTVGEVFAFAGLVIFLVLGGILIAELVYLLVLKAIQTALLTAQYMFAPIFLVFFATPSTENVCTGFIKAWVETSLWTFVWVGLLKILVIIMFSDYNPWGKILLAVGVLQMMIQVPTFLARAQISPMSDFVSAGLITGGLMKMFGWMGKTASSRVGQAVDYMNNQKFGARGFANTSKTPLNGLGGESGDPNKLKTLSDASKTGRDASDKKKPNAPPGGQKLNTNEAGQKKPETEAEKKAREKKEAEARKLAQQQGKGINTPQAGQQKKKEGEGLPGQQGGQGAGANGPQAKKLNAEGKKGSLGDTAAKAALAAAALRAAANGQNGQTGTGNQQGKDLNTEKDGVGDGKVPGVGDGAGALKDGKEKEEDKDKTKLGEQPGKELNTDDKAKKGELGPDGKPKVTPKQKGEAKDKDKQPDPTATGQQGGIDPALKSQIEDAARKAKGQGGPQTGKGGKDVKGAGGKETLDAKGAGTGDGKLGGQGDGAGGLKTPGLDDKGLNAGDDKDPSQAGKQTGQGDKDIDVNTGDGKNKPQPGEKVDPKTGARVRRSNQHGGYTATTLPDGTKIYEFDNGTKAVKTADGKLLRGAAASAAIAAAAGAGFAVGGAAGAINNAQGGGADKVPGVDPQDRNGDGVPDMAQTNRDIEAIAGTGADKLKPGESKKDSKTGATIKRHNDGKGTETTLQDGTKIIARDEGGVTVKKPNGQVLTGAAAAAALGVVAASGGGGFSGAGSHGGAHGGREQVNAGEERGNPDIPNAEQTTRDIEAISGVSAKGLGNGQSRTDAKTGATVKRSADGKSTETTLKDGTTITQKDTGEVSVRTPGVQKAVGGREAASLINSVAGGSGFGPAPNVGSGGSSQTRDQVNLGNEPVGNIDSAQTTRDIEAVSNVSAAGLAPGQSRTDSKTGATVRRSADGKSTETTLKDGSVIVQKDNGEVSFKRPGGQAVTGQQAASAINLAAGGGGVAGAGNHGGANTSREQVNVGDDRSGGQLDAATQTTRDIEAISGTSAQNLGVGQSRTNNANGTIVKRTDNGRGGTQTETTLKDGTQIIQDDKSGAVQVRTPEGGVIRGAQAASALASAVAAAGLSRTQPTTSTGGGRMDNGGREQVTVSDTLNSDNPGISDIAGTNREIEAVGGTASGLRMGESKVDSRTGATVRRVNDGKGTYTERTINGGANDGVQIIQGDNGAVQVRTPDGKILNGAAAASAIKTMATGGSIVGGGGSSGGATTVTGDVGGGVANDDGVVKVADNGDGTQSIWRQSQQGGVEKWTRHGDGRETRRINGGLLGSREETRFADGTVITDYDAGGSTVRRPGSTNNVANIRGAGGGGGGTGGGGTGGTGGTTGGGGGGDDPIVPLDPHADMGPRYGDLPKLSPSFFNASNFYMVPGVRGIVSSIKGLETRYSEGQQENSVTGSARGGAKQIGVRAGASDAEKAHAIMTAGFANEMTGDPIAQDAARQAAIDAGADNPQGIGEQLSANWMAYTGHSFKQTGTAKQRFQQSLYQQAALGSQAYIAGQSGNAYTQYLNQRFGAFTPEMDAVCTFLATDTESSESAWNAQIGPATDAMIASGIPIGADSRGAMQNSQIMQMRPGARRGAVRAVLRATFSEAMQYNSDPTSAEFKQIHGEIARGLPEPLVQAAISADAVSGGYDLSPDNLGSFAQISTETGMDAATTYKAMATGVGSAAYSVTGNSAYKSARSFDQVRHMVRQQHPNNPQMQEQVYGQILSASEDRARIMYASGISTRQMIDPGFANDLDTFIESHGGWAAINDTENPGARDNLQMAVSAASTTARHLGTAGFSPARAAATLQYMSAGGNPGTLSAGKIVVAERIVGMGGEPRDAMVESLIRLDPSGSGAMNLGVVEQVAAQVEAGNARPQDAVVVSRLIANNIPVNRSTIEVGIKQASEPGGFNANVVKVEAQLLESSVARSSGTAHQIVTNTVTQAAHHAGIDTKLPLNQMISQLESRGVTMDNIGDTIMDIQRKGGFTDRQMANPTLMQVAYETQLDPTSNNHTLQSIRVAEQIHGMQAIQEDAGIIEVYNEQAEYGVSARQMTMQTYHAARALQEARIDYHGTADAPNPNADPNARPVMPTMRNLQRIIEDRRFMIGNATLGSPASMDPELYLELALGRMNPNRTGPNSAYGGGGGNGGGQGFGGGGQNRF